MLGKIIGAVAGAKAANHVRGVGQTGGALLGVGATTLARRLSPLALVTLAAGAYAAKRYNARRRQQPKSAKA
jgi:hypothetical protein